MLHLLRGMLHPHRGMLHLLRGMLHPHRGMLHLLRQARSQQFLWGGSFWRKCGPHIATNQGPGAAEEFMWCVHCPHSWGHSINNSIHKWNLKVHTWLHVPKLKSTLLFMQLILIAWLWLHTLHKTWRAVSSCRSDQYVDLSQHHVTYVPYWHYHYSLQLQAKNLLYLSYCCIVFIPIVLLLHSNHCITLETFIHLLAHFLLYPRHKLSYCLRISLWCIDNNNSELPNNIPSLSFRHRTPSLKFKLRLGLRELCSKFSSLFYSEFPLKSLHYACFYS